MANEVIKRDSNRVTAVAAVTNDADLDITVLRLDASTKRLLTNTTVTGSVDLNQPGTPTVTSVGDTTTSTQLIAANTDRKEVEFYNNSSSILFLLKGSGTASSTNYTVELKEDGYYSTDFTGAFQGAWETDAGGSVLITESE